MFCYLYVSRLWDHYLVICLNKDLKHVGPNLDFFYYDSAWKGYIGGMTVWEIGRITFCELVLDFWTL